MEEIHNHSTPRSTLTPRVRIGAEYRPAHYERRTMSGHYECLRPGLSADATRLQSALLPPALRTIGPKWHWGAGAAWFLAAALLLMLLLLLGGAAT